MPPNPLRDFAPFLLSPTLSSVLLWLLLLGAATVAAIAWQRVPAQRQPRALGLLCLRIAVGVCWWQQSLWKIPPNYDGLLYWMKQLSQHAAIPLQGQLVGAIVIPNIAVFGPLVFAVEVAIGVSLILGLFSRLGALLGALMAINLWLGLYSAPGEWPWTYGFLVIIQLLFVIDPPGRILGTDILLFRRLPMLLA